MTELRPEVSGFYKGLIYCSDLEEAKRVSSKLDIVLKRNIRSDMSSKIKRGCSEYPIAFPLYKEINLSGPQPLEYNEEWKSIESDYDKSHSLKTKPNIRPTLRGLSLQDCLIIQNWFGYAKGVGDQTVEMLDRDIIYSNEFYELGRGRLKIHSY